MFTANPTQRSKSVLVGLASSLLAACSPLPDAVDTARYVPLSLAPAGFAGVKDRRADFRAVFCTEERDDGTALIFIMPTTALAAHEAPHSLLDQTALVAGFVTKGWQTLDRQSIHPIAETIG